MSSSVGLLLHPGEFTRPSIGGALIFVWLLWRLDSILKSDARVARAWGSKNALVVNLGRWLGGLRYLTHGPELVQYSYKRGVPYVISAPENDYIHFSSDTHIKELCDAPESKLSLHALSKDMLQPQYTMNGLEVQDRMNSNGTIHSKVLRVVLASNLQNLQTSLHKKIDEAFSVEFIAAKQRFPQDEWRSLFSFEMAKNVVRTANSIVFFGDKLSQEPEFLTAALQYPDDVLRTSEILRFCPGALKRHLAPVFMRQHRGANVMARFLKSVIDERIRDLDCPVAKPLDCIQWIIEANQRKDSWSTDKIIQVILGLWFASVHQLAISLVFALDDLCIYSEYVEPLRSEIASFFHRGDCDRSIDDMILLDSFLKESARLHPSDSISIRRKALVPYTFSDGTQIFPGDVACVPMRAIMRDEANYPYGEQFDGFRFMNKEKTGNISKMTDTDAKFPVWGLGKRSCPGRFYAVHALKLAVAHVLLTYDIQLADVGQNRNFHWRSATVPRSNTALLFRLRTPPCKFTYT